MRRAAKVALGAAGGVVGLVAVGVLTLTQTDVGRERVRGILVDRLESSAHGVVRVGPIRGNLLSGATIDGIEITDSTGAPFFRADTVSMRYSLLALARKRIDIANVRLVRPVVVLDKPPGLAWNFSRIFPSDTTRPPSRQGFGGWVAVRDLTVEQGRVIVRNEWLPPDSLTGEARERAIAEALSPDSRRWVIRVPRGYQSVQDYRRMNAHFDRLRLTNPDSAGMVFDVARLSMLALPLRPPAAVVRDLSGRVISSGDTIVAESLKVVLPGSSLTLNGAYDVGTGDTRATARAERLAFQDLRWLHPPLPAGTGTLDLSVDRRGERTRLAASRMELAVESARVAGNFDVTFGDSLRLGPSDVRFSSLDTRLIQRLAPAVRPPRHGTLNGRVALVGSADALQVDGNVSFVDAASGTSRVFADGEIGTAGGFRARQLRLRLAPVQLALASAAGPRIPVGGAVTGEALLTGSLRDGFDFRADLVHQAANVGRSRVTANGAILRRGDEFAARDLRIDLNPFQLAVARAFRPDLPLAGTVTGRATLNGVPAELALSADLVHAGGGTGRSRVVAEGGVALGDTFRARDLALRFDPLQMALVRSFSPDLPLGGALAGTARLNGSAADLGIVADLVHDSEQTGRSHVVANGAVALGESPRARNLRLRFDPLQMATVRAFNPDLELGGVLSGTARLDGTPADLDLVADLVHDSERTGRSHLVADGGVGFGETFRASDLRLRLDPLQIALVRAFNPDLPLDGSVAGRATVNGSTATRLAVEGDVTHQGSTGPSRLVGTASVPTGGRGSFAVDVRALPLSLATVGRFAPAAGLRGSASGDLRLTGTMRDLALEAGLAVENGGRVDATGRLDLASARKGYDLRASFGAFNAAAVTSRAPATGLTGTASAVGRGTDPATMAATIAADLTGARVGSVGVDSIRLRTRIADGLAAVDEGVVRLASAQADASGSFGLVAGRTGTLRYRVRVDTLSDLAGFAPEDTTRIPPRPAEIARAIERARADSLRLARATEVERAATGQPAEPTLRVDTVPSLPADSLAGSLEAEGVIAGNVERFDARGSAVMRNLVAFGSTVSSGAVTYEWLNAPSTSSATLTLDAELDSVRVRGFALDSVGGRVRYTGGLAEGTGSLDLAVRQDDERDYRAVADFSLSPRRKEVRYSDLSLRFDTTLWRAARPGAVSWADGGVELRDIHLLATDGAGRIFADGRLPADGPADLRLELFLEIGDVLALLQDSTRVRGQLALAAHVRGTGAAPIVTGIAAVEGAVVDTTRLGDLDARFDYADRQLRGDARLIREGRVLLTADGRLPIDLAVSGVTGPRLSRTAPLELDVRADSLPLESLPSFTPAVSDVRGRVIGTLAVRGTLERPETRGVVNLDLGSLKIVEPGVTLEQIAGTIRVEGDTAVVDSITALSADGTIRVAGGLDLSTLTEPGFDLTLRADQARVLDNDLGRLRADATLAMTGPWNAARITGDVRVESGVIYAPEPADLRRIPIDRASVTQLADTAALRIVTPNPLLANLRVDVGVEIARDTWVRNAEANVEIFTPPDVGALRVSMDRAAQTLALEGTLNAGRGEYTFAGRRIRLTQGSVVFLGRAPMDPILQLTAEQEVRLPNRPAFNIQLLVGGTLRAPRLTVASNAQPPIAESDLLSYFAFGESSSSLLTSETGGSISGGTGGGGAPLGPLGALATQQLGATAVGAMVDQVEAETTRSLKLDVFNITPAPLPPELAVQGYLNIFRGAQFEAGKYIANRWFLAAQGRTSAVLPGLLLEYRTPSGFSWVTSWEPRYLAQPPSLTVSQTPGTTNVLGLYLQKQLRF